MKFNKLSQLTLVSSIGLLVATLLSGCMIVTIDYAFVANSTGRGGTGQIQVFAVDSQSGAIRYGAPTVSSGGSTPVALAVSSDYANLYIANQTENNVVHFAIDSNGNLTKKDTITVSATPMSLAVNPAGTYLYVVYGSSSATLAEYALSSGTIASSATSVKPLSLSGYASDTLVPASVTVAADGGAVYAAAYDQSAYNPSGSVTSAANPGWVFGYAIGTSGTLTATTNSPYAAGVKPSAITTDPTTRFVYVTDYASNQLIGYGIGTTYGLTVISSGPFKTGNEPTSVVVDPRGKYIYVANALDNDVSAYEITLATGAPSTIVNSAASAAYSTDTQPVSIVVDPALGRFVYTANQLGNTVSGFRLNADTGAMTANLGTPYTTGYGPTSIAMVPHGNHSVQAVSK